jgi:site-specific recombinase XerD
MLIYQQTKNLRAVQLLLGHAEVESTVRYLGIASKMLLSSRNRPKFKVINLGEFLPRCGCLK